jgi:hypothetical protein
LIATGFRGQIPFLRAASLLRSNQVKKILSVVCASVLAQVAFAHHSAAMFDHARTVTYTGTVKQFQYTNPHSWLQVMVMGSDGKSVEWGFEAEGPSTLKQAGIDAKTFQPGEMVTIVANPMRDGRPAGALISATKADGKVYRPRPGPPPGPAPAATQSP